MIVSTPLMIKYEVLHAFSLTKSSCQKLLSLSFFLFFKFHSLFQKKSWCISTNCHLKLAFIDRHCPAVLLTARSLPPRSTLRRVLHLSISSTPVLRKRKREREVFGISKQLQHWPTFRSVLHDAWRTAYYCEEEELIKTHAAVM